MIRTLLIGVMLSAPRVHPGADVSLYLPRAGAGGAKLGAFLKSAAQHAQLLDPSSWKDELHPLFPIDFTEVASLAPYGIDSNGPATVSAMDGGRVTCTSLRDPKRFESRAADRFAAEGEGWKQESRGSVLKGVSAGGRVLEGYALRGREACAATHPTDAERLLKDSAVGLSSPGGSLPANDKNAGARIASLPGSSYLLTGGAVLGLDATPKQLTVEGVLPMGTLPPLTSGGSVPYGPEGALTAVPGEGLLFLRAQVAPAGVPKLVRTAEAELKRACSSCIDSAAHEALSALTSTLTGKIALHVGGIDLRGPLSKAAGRLFALKAAAIAEVTDSAKVSTILDGLAQKSEGGWKFRVAENRSLQLALVGRHLLVGNDDGSMRVLRASLSRIGHPMSHGAELWLDAPAVAHALGRVSLLDVLGTPELAAVVALSPELRPLLKASERVAATFDTQASSRGSETRLSGKWNLAR